MSIYLHTLLSLLPYRACLPHNDSFEYYVHKQPSRVFLGKGVLKICSKFTGEHPCQSVVSIKLLCS